MTKQREDEPSGTAPETLRRHVLTGTVAGSLIAAGGAGAGAKSRKKLGPNPDNQPPNVRN